METEPSTAGSVVKYQPKFGRVLIKREVAGKIGSIIIPENAAKRLAPCEGVIVALGETAGITESYNENGESVVLRTMKVGDKIVFGRHAGAWLDGNDENGTLFICQDQDILAVINKEAA